MRRLEKVSEIPLTPRRGGGSVAVHAGGIFPRRSESLQGPVRGIGGAGTGPPPPSARDQGGCVLGGLVFSKHSRQGTCHRSTSCGTGCIMVGDNVMLSRRPTRPVPEHHRDRRTCVESAGDRARYIRAREGPRPTTVGELPGGGWIH